jgi:hypothetical protein
MDLIRQIILITATALSPNHTFDFRDPITGANCTAYLQKECDMSYVGDHKLKLKVWNYDGWSGQWEKTVYLEGSAFKRK